jgi:hypothetical protein
MARHRTRSGKWDPAMMDQSIYMPEKHTSSFRKAQETTLILIGYNC